MKITAIHAHYVRIPFDMGAPRQEFAGLRFQLGRVFFLHGELRFGSYHLMFLRRR